MATASTKPGAPIDAHLWDIADNPEAMLQQLRLQSSFPTCRKLNLFSCACARLSNVWKKAYRQQPFLDMEKAAYEPVDWERGWDLAILWTACGASENLSHDQMADLLRDIFGNPFRPKPVCITGSFDEWMFGSRKGGVIGLDIIGWNNRLIPNLAQQAYEQRLPDGLLDPQRLAVLADALEDAGCAGECRSLCDGSGRHSHDGRQGMVIHGVLHDCDPRKFHHHHDAKCLPVHLPHPMVAHLRQPGPHVRGCWALDLLLGKE